MQLSNEKQKVIVIGGGPGGYVAAIRAAQLGGDVTLIEKNKLGGTCLNVGCIPTKVLLHAAYLMDEAKHAENFGIDVSVDGFNWEKVLEKKESISNQLVKGIHGLMKANKIKVINGVAEFVSSNAISVTKEDGKKEILNGGKIIIATGSVPVIPPIPGVKENPNCIDSTGALSLSKVPKSLLIIGGGVIGVEFASIFNQFGTKVTIIEALPKILPLMDGEITAQLKTILEQKGIDILTEAKVKSVESSPVGAKVNVDYNGEVRTFEVEKVLVATGRKANTESLNLNQAGIEHVRGNIKVNEKMETNVKGVYAIGDCLGQLMLAHVASAQGEVAAENAMGLDVSYNGKTVPSCVYTNPEIASVGLTEEKAKEEGIEYETGIFPLIANGKALIENGGEGIVKVVIGKEYKEVLGVHILGPRATDIIAECALAIGMEATVEDIIGTVHAHPTITESIKEAFLSAEKRAIHMINR